MKNHYYKTCPTCGANLDPGERCEDCYPCEQIPYPDARRYKFVDKMLRKEETSNATSQTPVSKKMVH